MPTKAVDRRVFRWANCARAALIITALPLCSCEAPYLTKSGMLVFPEHGAHGAAVVTENGLEFHDRDDIPRPVVVREAGEPFRTPVGFILPSSGRFTKTSQPTVLTSSGIVIVLRPSDTRVPSWGGEILLRADVHVPGESGASREGERVAIIIDGESADIPELTESVFAQLGAKDTITVIDARGARVVVPPMKATHRSLGLAATNLHLLAPHGEPAHLLGALEVARASLGALGARRVVLFSDGRKMSHALHDELQLMASAGIALHAFGMSDHAAADDLRAIVSIGMGSFTADATIAARTAAVRRFLPPSGKLMFRDLTITVGASPAPAHILESSAGDAVFTLDGGELPLGDMRAGDARSEMMRITVPAWSVHNKFKLTVTAHAEDVALGITRNFRAEVDAVYDDDIERIAESRNGDVIAYASALATLHRLNAAFVGEGVTRVGGLRKLAKLHAESLALLSRDFPDRGFAEDAAMLRALLDASD
ncbi:MAG: hypothetical protein NVSMB1_19770 [Polyangiales bacterium]